jgi:transglutaminase-like putative cysteine protease
MPARLVSGHRYKGPGRTLSARQIWSEIKVDDLGWVAFDATDDTCPCEESVRVAIGLDVAGILPVRAGHYGGPADFEQDTTIDLVAMTA